MASYICNGYTQCSASSESSPIDGRDYRLAKIFLGKRLYMIDEWQPAASVTQIDVALLQLICAQTSPEQPSQIPEIDASQQAQLASYIQGTEQLWYSVLDQLEVSEMLALAFFYTRAEEKWSAFTAGSDNPAIWIFRYLKTNNQLPEKTIIKQLKKETKNRFIPYGSVL